ncbi:MAG: hypothetical protein AB1487_05105, partial [Thermodesulfobacteriota bacterium]
TDFHPHPDPPPKGEGWVGAQAGHLAWLANKRPALGNSMAGFLFDSVGFIVLRDAIRVKRDSLRKCQ